VWLSFLYFWKDIIKVTTVSWYEPEWLKKMRQEAQAWSRPRAMFSLASKLIETKF